MKISGKEWNEFYNDKKYWPDYGDIWHEDELVTINDNLVDEINYDLSTIKDTDLIEVKYGVVYLGSYEKTISLLSYFKRWKKEQNNSIVMFTCKKEDEAYFIGKLEKHGAKIVR